MIEKNGDTYEVAGHGSCVYILFKKNADHETEVCRESQEIGLEYNVKERDEYENSWAVTGLKPYDRVK